ncbi:MAG: hypothetical protein ACRD1S_15865 [Vicinamibacterales bacterium]
MPLRSFWTIVMEGRPTAFRSGQREELIPTLKQLQSRHPDTHLMWFQNGRYWHSPLDARRPRGSQTRGPRTRAPGGPQKGRGPQRTRGFSPRNRAPRKGRGR